MYLPKIGIPWEEWFAHKDWGVPVRKSEVEYFNSLWPGESFEIRVGVLSVGDSSAQFGYEFVDGRGEIAAIAKTLHVFATRPVETMQKFSIPSKIRAKLKVD